MAIMMVFELNEEIALDQLRTALIDSGAEPFDEETFNFKISKMYCVLSNLSELEKVGFLEFNSPSWMVRFRVVFHYVNANFSECSLELHNFIERIRLIENSRFFLAFQNEAPCAVKNGSGYFILDKF